jgi:hypothetical protein
MECKLCGSTKFRISRLRVADLSGLAFLQYPVRCRVCHKRELVNFFTAYRIRRADKRRHAEERRRKYRQANSARHA